MINELLNFSFLEIDTELFRRGNFDHVTLRNGKRHVKQEQALKILTDKTTVEFLYGGAAGGAKSWTGCAWLLFSCIAYPGTKWFIGRESLKRLRESTLITFFKVAKEYKVKKEVDFIYKTQDHYIQFANGSRIDLLDLRELPGDPLFERYGSVEYTGGWIEEGGEVSFGAYDTLKTRIGRHMNDKYSLLRKLFITCNPKKNWMYNIFYKPSKSNQLKPYQKYLAALSGDNPFGESEYINALNSITDKAKKQRLLFGNWEYDDDPLRLIEYDRIVDLFSNNFVKTGPKYISADIAERGSDKFVIGVWDGLRLVDIVIIDKCLSDEIERTIKTYANLYEVPRSNIVYDADGLGTFLRGYLKGAKPFNNNSKALNNENYKNLKTQCYYKLAEIVNTNKMFIESQEHSEIIIEELEQVKRVESDDNKLQIIDKVTIKDLIGRSPDIADMLMMRMLFEIKPKGSMDWRKSN